MSIQSPQVGGVSLLFHLLIIMIIKIAGGLKKLKSVIKKSYVHSANLP
ncbi:MAG: hypothetical protein ACD_24C00219G0002 [uncultured bacterium]|nr:MAG: hypothetical protein ACD_24C00219G0002 [uncultured bacterium]